MNILLLDLFGSFLTEDMLYCIKKLGHNCKNVQFILADKEGNDEFSAFMKKELSECSFDMVLTTNYYPAVARICYVNNIVYCAWVYDSPPEIQSLETLDYSTNRIFFFCRYDYESYKNQGFDNVYYLPLGANIERLSSFKAINKYQCDVSLVGGLYHSDSFLGLKSIMAPEQQQFLEAMVQVQLKHAGSMVLDSALTEDFVEQVCRHYKDQSEMAVQPNKAQLFYSICAHITHMERLALLRLSAGNGYSTRLYASSVTDQNRDLLTSQGVEIHGPVNYGREMPQVFLSSKINLNPTLRANRTGIPLRVVDVLGVGGFLLTTHQAELDDFFFEDEIATYECVEEAIEKIDYYLSHESERVLLAAKGHERAKKDFSFEDRIMAIMYIATKSR